MARRRPVRGPGGPGEASAFAVGRSGRRSDAPARRPRLLLRAMGWSRRDERAERSLEAIADAIEARESGHHRYLARARRDFPRHGLRASAGVTTGSCGLFASHIRRWRLSSTGAVDRRHCRTRKPAPRADIRAGAAAHPARSGAVWRIELPARLLDGGRRHGVGAGCRLPGGGQGPSRPFPAPPRCVALSHPESGSRRQAKHAGRLLADPVEHQTRPARRW